MPSEGKRQSNSFKVRSLTSFFSESSFFLGGSWCLVQPAQLTESSLGEACWGRSRPGLGNARANGVQHPTPSNTGQDLAEKSLERIMVP